MEWRVSTKMKNLVISRIILSAIIRRRSRSKRICIPRSRAYFSRIHAPIVINFKNSIVRIIITTGKLYLHFKEINKTSNDKRNEDVSPVCCLQAHDVNHHSKHYQYTSVAPKKAQRLDGVIKNFLPFLYCLNLHVLLINIFHEFIVPVQFLKIHVFAQKIKVIVAEKLWKNDTFQEVLI